MVIFQRRSLKTSDKERTKAAELTLKESIYPLCLVTVLFFLWVRIQSEPYTMVLKSDHRLFQGFSYGLLDTLNKHFQNTLGITRARSSGLQAAYFG
jgi:FHS family L-fucose permease-like MFS transporter